MNKKLNVLLLLVLSFFMSMSFVSCSDGDDDDAPSNIVGTWFSEGDGHYNIVLVFNSDKTGYYSMESRSSYAEYKFTYKVKGNEIQCTGTRVTVFSNSGDVSTKKDWKVKYTISGNRLYNSDYTGIDYYVKD